MKPEHIDGLVKVEEECFASGFGRQTFEKELENKIAVYVTAVSDGRVCGYAGLWNICGEADIMNVGVARDMRRRGIAEGMLRRLMKICAERGIYEVNLEVRESNAAARALYKKLGFEKVGLRRGYYGGKEDAVLMKRAVLEEDTDENTCH